MICKRSPIVLGLFFAAAVAQAALAQTVEVETPKLTIHPMAAPRPALKYQLLPEFKDRIRGNAAVYYGKVTAEHTNFFGNRPLIEKIDEWRAAPLADLLKPDVEMRSAAIEKMLRLAARCESCDWQLPFDEEPYLTMGLPEVQQLRQFARILAARARIQMAHGEFDAAIVTLQSGFAIARNVTEGETLVNDLVGIATVSIMTDQLFEMVQQPDAPNLYWALTMLPRPLIDIRKGIETERNSIELSFPDLRDLHAERSAEQWQASLLNFWKVVLESLAPEDPPTAEALIAESLKDVAADRAALVAQGRDEKTVAAMPDAQVVLISMITTYEIERDNLLRWSYVPFADGQRAGELSQHQKEIDAEQNPMKRIRGSKTRGKLSQFLLPALLAVRRADVRMERDISILRIIEALRLFGASHDGRLPENLNDFVESPIPLDPFTGKPFDYRLQGETATLSGSPTPGRPTSYEIKMVRQP